MKKMNYWFAVTGLLFVSMAASQIHAADEKPAEEPKETSTAPSDAAQDEQEKQFANFGNMLKKSALIGTFTVDGIDKAPRPERYEISKIVKQPQGDYWLFYSRIKYGSHDVTLPIPVQVKWAGTTPVITVDNLTIPGMGTFDARVLIADNKYAGTWRHGDVGGLMFGRIEKQEEKEAEEEKETE